MDITRIPAEPDPTTAAAVVMAELAALGSRSFALPDDAELDPALPESGGVTAVWVRAGGASVEEGVVSTSTGAESSTVCRS